MASSDPEKRAILTAEDDRIFQSPQEKPPRRRALHWLVIFLGALVVFSIGVTSRRCSAATSLFTSHGASQSHHAHAGLASQGIISRSPANRARETTATTSAAAPNRTVLKTFEVAQPVLMPDGPAESDGSTRDGRDYSPELCSVLLMRHDFAWSYNAPFVGKRDRSLLCVACFVRGLT